MGGKPGQTPTIGCGERTGRFSRHAPNECRDHDMTSGVTNGGKQTPGLTTNESHFVPVSVFSIFKCYDHRRLRPITASEHRWQTTGRAYTGRLVPRKPWKQTSSNIWGRPWFIFVFGSPLQHSTRPKSSMGPTRSPLLAPGLGAFDGVNGSTLHSSARACACAYPMGSLQKTQRLLAKCVAWSVFTTRGAPRQWLVASQEPSLSTPLS